MEDEEEEEGEPRKDRMQILLLLSPPLLTINPPSKKPWLHFEYSVTVYSTGKYYKAKTITHINFANLTSKLLVYHTSGYDHS